MRKLSAALLAALCCACLTACAATNHDTYEYAERSIGMGEYHVAAALFAQLGEYRDAAEYRLYAEALDALDDGSLDLARANFELIAPFKSSTRYLACIDAIELDKAGETAAALAIYRTLGTFAEAHIRVAELEEELAAQALRLSSECGQAAAESLQHDLLTTAARAVRAIHIRTLQALLASTLDFPAEAADAPAATAAPADRTISETQAPVMSSVFRLVMPDVPFPSSGPDRDAAVHPTVFAHCAE